MAELKPAKTGAPRSAKATTGKADGESDVLAKIAEMPKRIAPSPSGSMP